MGKLSEQILQEKPPEALVVSKRGRGADADRRAAILDCAEAVFLEFGFQAASMSAIAAKLGGSKGTLYNYFPSKEELFVACVSRHCEGVRDQMSTLFAEGADIRETLTRMGERFVAVVSSEDVVRKFRLVVGEAERSPEIARAFYETGPQAGSALLATYLETAMDQGALTRTDPVRAARYFIGLCTNWLSKARLCNVTPEPDAETIASDVKEAVRIFLAAYGARAD
jgi:AcrR family transcriptional regulator